MTGRGSSIRQRSSVALRFWIGPRVLHLLPRKMGYRTAAGLARRRFRSRRSQLALRIGEMESLLGADRDTVERWLERAFESGASEQLDVSVHHRMTQQNVTRFGQVEGAEHLQWALRQGRGAILVSGHVYGLFTFFVALALRGLRVNMLTLPPNREPAAFRGFKRRRFEYLTDQLGIRPLSIETSNFAVAVQARNALSRNELVTIVIDQSSSKPLVDVDFLSGRAQFPLGPALLAQASGAPLLPFWIHRPDGWRPQIAEIGEPLFVEADLEAAVARCAAWLEGRILADPPSWSLWLNPNYELPTPVGEAVGRALVE